MGKILITRPKYDSLLLRDILSQQNLDVIIHPMMDINYLDVSIPSLDQYGALIFTSINAVRSFIEQCPDRTLNVFCVGHKTAEELKKAGFYKVHEASNSVESLVKCLQEEKPLDKPYLYLRGQHVTKDLQSVFGQEKVQQLTVYESHKIKNIQDSVSQALINGNISEVVFYSQRTVESFYEAVFSHKQAQRLIESIARTRALFLSDSMISYASEILGPKGIDIHWKTTLAPAKPTTDALVELLKELHKEI